VGEENIKMQEQIAALATEKQQLLDKWVKLNTDNETALHEHGTAMTNEALRITNDLSLGRNFRRPDLQALLNDDSIDKSLLSGSEFKTARETALSSQKLDALAPVSLSIELSLFQRTTEILNKCVAPSKTIAKLKQNATLESWVRTGRTLHEKESTCQFCGNTLPTDLLSSLDAHFSKDYEAFRKEVEDFISALDSYKITVILPDKNALYRNLQQDYQTRAEVIKKETEKYNAFIERLREKAIVKKNHLMDAVPMDGLVLHDCSRLTEAAEGLNETIGQHNQRTTEFDRIRQERLQALKKHYAAQFSTGWDYKKRKEEIQHRTDEISRLNARIDEIDKENQQILTKVSEMAKGADSLNWYITRYFGQDSPLSIHVDADDAFRVYRGEMLANNLSEGEKTAISFAHFLTSLKDRNIKDVLGETIVYVDDPVSSLDRNHLYNTYALIAACLKKKCGQLFVSTHNFEFFNLLKDEFKAQHTKKCNFATRNNDAGSAPLFQVVRGKDNASIKNLDCLLCHFKSEYLFLFYQLCEFRVDVTDDYTVFTIPNLLRRFLEAYFAFMHPAKRGLADNLTELFPDAEIRKMVHKILDEFSHNENTERVFQLYTAEEIFKAIESTFIALEKARPEYFRELRACITPESNFD
jgi:wobble nucleotide-excising tRNase